MLIPPAIDPGPFRDDNDHMRWHALPLILLLGACGGEPCPNEADLCRWCPTPDADGNTLAWSRSVECLDDSRGAVQSCWVDHNYDRGQEILDFLESEASLRDFGAEDPSSREARIEASACQ